MNGRVLSTHSKIYYSSSFPPQIKPLKKKSLTELCNKKKKKKNHSFASRDSPRFILMDESGLFGKEISRHWNRLLSVCTCVLRSPSVKNDGLLIWRRPGRDVPRVRRQGFRVSLRTSDLRKLQGWCPHFPKWKTNVALLQEYFRINKKCVHGIVSLWWPLINCFHVWNSEVYSCH